MAKFTKTLTVDGDTAVCVVNRRKNDANNWTASIFTYGGGGNNFGGGTVAMKISPDGGTTKIAMKDFTGTAITGTAAYVFNTQPIGNPNRNQDTLTIYASLSGSTSPTIIVDIFDNR